MSEDIKSLLFDIGTNEHWRSQDERETLFRVNEAVRTPITVKRD